MLPEQHLRTSHQSSEHDDGAYGPDGVKSKPGTERPNQSGESSDADHVYADFPPHVHDEADHLRHKCRDEHSIKEVEDRPSPEEDDAGECADEGDGILYVPVAPHVELPPAEIESFSKKIKRGLRNDHGEYYHDKENNEPCLERYETVCAEKEKPQQCPDGSIERREYLGEYSRRLHEFCFS